MGCCLILTSLLASLATEFHVSVDGNDANPGTRSAPFRTIQRAAELAQPGDTVTVHQGTYRERINPVRGGVSDAKRIVYRAAQGEKAEIKGSEPVKGWVRSQGDVWKVTFSNSFFGNFNPYNDLIHGDWFNAKGRPHHTGAVYLNDDWLVEAGSLEEVMSPGSPPKWLTEAGDLLANVGLWFARVDGSNTTVWAQFKGVNPNEQNVEVNVRRTIFYAEEPGINFITVRGFRMEHAATPWAPPTAEQVGLIGTHWSKGWIIENNHISHSVCCGIALGKYGDQWDDTSADTAEGYVKTIERALRKNWNRDTIGHHIVRNNVISHCEQAGIVGSLGAAFSTVEGNEISDIHVRRLFTGAEMAAIKFHAAIDCVIRNNQIRRACLGLWLDWMAQGARVSANAFYENGRDLFVEVNHGPFVVDNNLFLSSASLLDMSEGGAYVHNLFTGTIISAPELNRQTPYHPAHSTTVAGLTNVHGGDCRFYNNIFGGAGGRSAKENAAFGLASYNKREVPLQTSGNIYCAGALPYAGETNCVMSPANLNVQLLRMSGKVTLQIDTGLLLEQPKTCLITTELLGKAKIASVPYENADGTYLRIDADFSGKKRDGDKPTPGPFETPGGGAFNLLVAISGSSLAGSTLSDPAVDAYNVRLGTQTFAGLYHFTTNTPLVETAQAIQGMGSGIIKFYLGSNFPAQYGQNLPSNVTNLLTLARDLPSCHQVLDMPFTRLICWAYPFSNSDAPFADGNYTSIEANNDYREMYNLTRYLLTNYNNSGKTFFLGHWEGDGYLNVNNWSTNPAPAVVQGMIDWENQRQRAVDDAKSATCYTNVTVFYYAEANRVRDAMLNGPANNQRVINYVVPFLTNLDFLSYSSYDAMDLGVTDLYATLDYAEARLPTNKVSTIPGERIWIGEYGWGGSQSADQEPTTRAYIQRLLNYGRQSLPMILFWEIYNNEPAKLYGLIDSNNLKTACYYLHSRFINNARLYTARFKETHGRLPSDSEFVSLVSPMLNQPLAALVPLSVMNSGADVGTNGSTTVFGTLAQGVYGDDFASVWVFYGPQDGAASRGAWEKSLSVGLNTHFNPYTFTATLTNLASNTNYFFRFYATNSSGEVWAPASSSFSTLMRMH